MSRTYKYRSGLTNQINAFIEEKRACGCKYEKEAKTFYEWDSFLVAQGVTDPILSKPIVETLNEQI